MSVRNLNKDLFDAVLRNALAQLEEEETDRASQLLDQFENFDHPPSLRFRRRMRRLLRTGGGGTTAGKRVLRAVASFAVAFCLAGGSFAVAQANGINLYKLIFQTREEYTSIHLSPQLGEAYLREKSKDWPVVYYPQYLPRGFALAQVNSSPSSYTMVFFDGEQEITIKQFRLSMGGDFRVDTEDTDMEEIRINGEKALYLEKNGEHRLVCSNNLYVFIIKSPISKREMIKIAENLKNFE